MRNAVLKSIFHNISICLSKNNENMRNASEK